jgi:hypothetical protein
MKEAAAEDRHLPGWLFDIIDDEEDSESTQQKSLLEELEIDPKHIYRNIVWMLIGPCLKIVGRPYKRHPLYVSNANVDKHSIDFWGKLVFEPFRFQILIYWFLLGPCAVVSFYCLILWLGRVKEVAWIFVIWSIAAILNHFASRVFYRSSLMIHIALLGYSITPVIPFAAIILFLNPPLWLATLLEFISISWAATSAILSYSTIVSISVENKPKLYLLFPTVILMELYITSLIPLIRK